jgi:outer membrane protein assembly factor BamB
MPAKTRCPSRWLRAAALAAVLTGALAAQQPQPEGRRIWAVPVQGWITWSSPALSPDGLTVYVGVFRQGSGRLVALNSQGVNRWAANKGLLPQPVDSSPAVAPDGTIYIGCVDERLYAFDPGSGDIKWSVATGGFVSSSPAIAADGTVYFGSSSGRLHAVTRDGVERWSSPFATGGIIDSSPAIAADGTIYVGSWDKNLYAVTPGGVERWRFPTGGVISSSPAIGADGTIYVGSEDQRLYALSPDGARKWEYLTNGPIQSSPVLGADGTVYFGADRHFYALHPADAVETREKWKTDLGSTLASTAAVRGDGVIIFGADDGKVRALEPDTGAVRWVFDTQPRYGDVIESSPVVAPDGSIYVGSEDGMLYKLSGNGSPLSEYSSWPAFRRDTTHSGRATTVTGAARLVNLSTRARAGGSDKVIVGFFVQGLDAKAFLVRGVGPTLQRFGVSGFMADPRLELYSGERLHGSNDNWEEVLMTSGQFSLSDTAAGVEAFALPPGSKDAALVEGLFPGLYTTLVRSTDGRGGVVLVEAYDARGGDESTRLVNVSMRNQVGQGEDVLIMGFVVAGTGPSRLLVRAVGPGLRQFGVTGVLEQPSMTVFSGNQRIRSNNGWTTEGLSYDLEVAARAVSAFALQSGSRDCAMVLTVQPGPYTVQISGSNGSTGEALAEVYVLP